MANHKNTDINTISLVYHPELSLNYFEAIKHKPWAMLLRSPAHDHSDNRYDILVANPIATIETKGKHSRIRMEGQETSSHSDPFSIIADLQDSLVPHVNNQAWADYPFIGGALGYFAYDLGRQVESIPENALDDISLPDMAIGLYNWALIVDHNKQVANLVGIGIEAVHTWLESVKSQHIDNSTDFAVTSEWTSNMSQSEYAEKFNTIQDYLQSGDCYQINLTQRFNASYSGDEWQAYRLLEDNNKAPFSAFLRLDDHAIISISPERFIALNDGCIETKPIKGTMPRSSVPKDDLINAEILANSAKDQSENLMIVDLLRNDIGRVAQPGSVCVPKLFNIESFPAVHHMVSTITAKLDDDKSATDLLRACFPGGSITGAPKVRAMEIIEELEPHRRSVYCGSIGYISRHGRMDTSITIRTLIAKDSQLYVWAGGGIVADSKVGSEYQETYDKLSKILPILSS
ncbi:aminodeoxychorismate synthase component 1 [Vibrio sp.]|nr:aminodeoxychorismate synthase component 1 [Vibrio viridaestus]MDC0610709.1 aminodeoxychorismate synthase component 1 [Vibrio sp.]